MSYPATPLAPPTIRERISIAVPERDCLRRILLEAGQPSLTIRESKSRISTLTMELEEANSLIAKLHHEREIRETETHSYRDSKVLRFSYNLTGNRENFAEKRLNKENEFFVAAKKYTETEVRVAQLEAQLARTKETLEKAEKAEKRMSEASDKLYDLYESIFAGPTPEFPEEDEMETLVAQLRRALDKARDTLENEKKGKDLLEQAYRAIYTTHEALNEAYHALDCWTNSANGKYTDKQEQDAILKVNKYAKETRKLVMNAWLVNSRVAPVRLLLIPSIRPRDDSRPLSVHEIFERQAKIRRDDGEALFVMNQLSDRMLAAKQRIPHHELELGKLEQSHSEERQRLRELRQKLFYQVIDELPDYSL